MGSENGKVSSRKGRPNYPMEFKRRLAAASCEGKMSASRLAREHGVNANLLFKWRRQYRAGELGGPVDDRCVLLPVALAAPEGSPPMLCATRASVVETEARVASTESCVEIDVGGLTVRVRGTVDIEQLGRVLGCVRQLS